MAKTEITINIPMEEVWQMLKQKYNVDDTVQCEAVIKSVWKGDQRDGYQDNKVVSLQLKYEK